MAFRAVGRRAPDTLVPSAETGTGVTGLLAQATTPAAGTRPGVRPEGPGGRPLVTVAAASFAGLARLVTVATTTGLVLVRMVAALTTPLVALGIGGRANGPTQTFLAAKDAVMAIVGLEATIKTRGVIARIGYASVARPGSEVAELRPEGEVDPRRVAAPAEAKQLPALEAVVAPVNRSSVQAVAAAGRRRRKEGRVVRVARMEAGSVPDSPEEPLGVRTP